MNINKISIKPTIHYLTNHSDVEWDVVISTVLCPSKTHKNQRHGKDRFTYIKKYKKFSVEIHTKNDDINEIIWIINAFKNKR